jgi:hypothetical protein
MSSRVTITWTPHKYRHLEKAYAAAIEARRDTFLFEGHTLATAYAKYLLLHLRQKFNDLPLGSGHDIKD